VPGIAIAKPVKFDKYISYIMPVATLHDVNSFTYVLAYV